MSRDREYDTLLNKYNILVAKYRDVSEQMRVKSDQMAKYEAAHDVIEKHARELCEMILAKDRAEMVLGNNRTWNTFSTDEMIAKAKLGFIKHNQQKTEILNQVMAIAERRGQELDSLKDQLAQMMTSGNIASLTAEQMIEKAKSESEKQAAIKKTPATTQEAIKAGQVDCIIEEEEDFEDGETVAIQDMMDLSVAAKLSPVNAAIKRSCKKTDVMETAQKNSVALHTVDLHKATKEWSECEWFIIEQIGTTGVAKGTDIIELAERQFGADKDATIRRSLGKMTDQNILDRLCVSLPRSKKISLYSLSYGGSKIFEERFKKKPVESEISKITKEHDNPEHGYGIMDLRDALTETGKYREVSMMTRNTPFDVVVGGRNYKYIPDLVCKANKYTDYFEYELGKTTQHDFNMKCSKMCQVTKYLNFVAPNQKVAAKLKSQVDIWIGERGIVSLKDINVRIGTIASLGEDGKWLVLYRLSQGAEPTENYFDKANAQ